MPTLPPGLIEARPRNPLTDAPRRDRGAAAGDMSGVTGGAGLKGKRGSGAMGARDDDQREFSQALSLTLDRRKGVSDVKDAAESAPRRKDSADDRAESAQGGAKSADRDVEKSPSGRTRRDAEADPDAESDTVTAENAAAVSDEQPAPSAEDIASPASAAAAQAASAPATGQVVKPRGGSSHNAASAGEGVAAAVKPASGNAPALSPNAESPNASAQTAAPANGSGGLVEVKPGTESAASAGQNLADGPAQATKAATAQPSAAPSTEQTKQASNAGDAASPAATTGLHTTTSADAGTAASQHTATTNTAEPGSSFASMLGNGADKGTAPTASADSAGSQAGQGAGSARNPAGGGTGEMSQLESLVSRGLSASLAQRGGTLTMRLTPESLGAMRIQMDVQQGVVNVSMEVANPQAHRLLMESIDTLRHSLEARGLAVEKIGVSLVPGSFGPSGINGAGTASHAGSGNPPGGGGSSGTGDQNAQRQDANGQGFANHDAGDGRSRSWLGGDQREDHRRPGGAAAHAPDRTDAEAEDFGGLWQRLRLGVDTRV